MELRGYFCFRWVENLFEQRKHWQTSPSQKGNNNPMSLCHRFWLHISLPCFSTSSHLLYLLSFSKAPPPFFPFLEVFLVIQFQGNEPFDVGSLPALCQTTDASSWSDVLHGRISGGGGFAEWWYVNLNREILLETGTSRIFPGCTTMWCSKFFRVSFIFTKNPLTVGVFSNNSSLLKEILLNFQCFTAFWHV